LQFTISNITNANDKLKLSKSAGEDQLMAEHIVYAHPCLLASLKIFFNLMLKVGYVPNAFGRGIMIPLVKDSNGDITVCENYRCITLSCIISKLFEYSLFDLCQSCMVTNDLQFGFKAGIGCSDALFTLKNVVNYFNNNGSTVTLTALDISKAFDKVSHFKLFTKLLKRGFPKCFVNILVNWYSKCSACVRWNGVFSASFSVIAGVRQGGILSPVLFAIYIDDIVNQLAKMNYGCMIGGQYIGCILYADDIILLSQSVTCMQLMINVACSIVDDLLFNVTKSAVIRIW
jgi:hypothetical protein